MKAWLWCLLLFPALAHAVPPECLSTAPVPLRVRIGTATPIAALLVGGSAPTLRVVDAASGMVLWSAGPGDALQRFDELTAPFAGSLTALDLDNDGLHDRLYAGDLAGRLWRFDLHHGAAPEAWATGGVFADFSNTAGRGFVAAPDVSLGTAPGRAPWLNIAIGTAAPGADGALNRFYVLRDHAPFESWTAQQYRDWQPLVEGSLQQIDPSSPQPLQNDTGWFLVLERGDVLAAALTVAGRTVFTVSDSGAAGATGCRSAFDLVTVVPATGTVVAAGEQWRRPLGAELPMASAFTLSPLASEAIAQCAFGTERVADCDVDLGPRRTWWRREDAE